MGTREELHYELLTMIPNAYFQPPSSIRMKYPCVVYHKTTNYKDEANGQTYRRVRGYMLTVIETNPDSLVSELIEDMLNYCSITGHYVVDGLHHTTLQLYY